jgi:hypothetical protein
MKKKTKRSLVFEIIIATSLALSPAIFLLVAINYLPSLSRGPSESGSSVGSFILILLIGLFSTATIAIIGIINSVVTKSIQMKMFYVPALTAIALMIFTIALHL